MTTKPWTKAFEEFLNRALSGAPADPLFYVHHGAAVLPSVGDFVPRAAVDDTPLETSEREAEVPTSNGGIGDINSTAPGSAARYNGGKVPLDLVPLGLIAEYADQIEFSDFPFPRGSASRAKEALDLLGEWQKYGDRSYLLLALVAMGDRWDDCARVFDFGRRKYAEWNWAKGFQWSVPLACAARHLVAVMRGEPLDKDSGLHHFGHVYCNIVMLLTFEDTYPEGDDRPRLLEPKADVDFPVIGDA